MAVKSVMLLELIPEGCPRPEHFSVVDVPGTPACSAEGDVLLQVLVMSADPFQRSRVKEGEVPRVMEGFVAGKVVASMSARWPVGSLMGASLPYTTLQVVTAERLAGTVAWDLTGYVSESQISLGVGVLGMPGATAYGGLFHVLRPEEGQTLLVSAAAGAVGGFVGQLAKNISKCTVIGICGGPEKCAFIKEKFGFDHAIDYKTVSDKDALAEKIREVAPDGIDMYFENVGGMHFEAAMATLRLRGRVAVCGTIGKTSEAVYVPESINIRQMIYSFQRIEGFTCGPWLTGAAGSFLKDMHGAVTAKSISVEETVFDGVERWPEAFIALFTGQNKGKVVVRIGLGNESAL